MKPAVTVVPKIRKVRRESYVALRASHPDARLELNDQVDPDSELAETAETPALLVREFMVWSGDGDAVGPVSADLIARGIRAGKVPTDACVQRLGDLFAFNVLDEPDVIAALERCSD